MGYCNKTFKILTLIQIKIYTSLRHFFALTRSLKLRWYEQTDSPMFKNLFTCCSVPSITFSDV